MSGLKQKRKLIIFASAVLVLLAIALMADMIAPYDPNLQDLEQSLQAPGQFHILGTDRYGRDVFSRVLSGGKVTIFASVILVIIVVVWGSVIGLISGYCGGKTDSILMRICDVFLAFPALVFAVAVAGMLSGGLVSAMLALGFVSWPKYARMARAATLNIKDQTFFLALQLSGCRHHVIIFKHILPHILAVIMVSALGDVGTMMMELAGLSFLGLGVLPPTAEWGAMMAEGTSMLQLYPWVIIAPGIAIFITVMLFNLFGDALRDYMDCRRQVC